MDESQLDLDDSEFAWDKALEGEDPEAEALERAEAARIEAVFTRMEDTVRRTFESEVEDEALVQSERSWLDGAHDLEIPDHPEPELVLLDEAALPSVRPSDQDREPDTEEPEPLILDDVEIEPDRTGAELLAGQPAAPAIDPDSEDFEFDDEDAGYEAAGYEAAGYEAARYEQIEAEPGEDPEPVVAPAPVPVPAWGPETDLPPFTASSLRPDDEHEASWEPVGEHGFGPEPGYEPGYEDEPQPAPFWADADSAEPEPAGAEPATADGKAIDDAPGHPTRRGMRVAAVAVACVAVVLAAGLVATRVLNRTTTPVARPAAARPVVTTPPATTLPVESPALAAARLQTATDEADSATTTALAGLSSLPSFPTPTNVAAVVNPYVASLLLYQAYLSGATVPASARQDTTTASEEIRNDLTFLDTINGLPPIELGSFIGQFQSDTAQLQSTLVSIEHDLSPSGHS